tara:strand:+ start:55 stop:186 length:132 start_codon:yes stop_codon:yes gene_type:complete
MERKKVKIKYRINKPVKKDSITMLIEKLIGTEKRKTFWDWLTS